MVDDELKAEIGRRWRDLGYESEGAWLHALLRVSIYGVSKVANDEANRLASLVGHSTVTGTRP